ncbi:MAG: ATP-binding protein, partial [Planctomycetota bacterium]|nr:ATP-binding protein [Planctomycetota bacterium]
LRRRVAACEAALDEVGSAFADLAATTAAERWNTLEDIRAQAGLTGLLVETGTQDADWWAGRPIALGALPAHAPWHRSFREGRVEYHAGPFVRALVVGPQSVGSGKVTATSLLEEVGPEDAAAAPFERLWLEPLDLRAVTLRHPASPPDADCPETCQRRLEIANAQGLIVLVADIRVHDLAVLRERIEIEQAGSRGLAWLVALLLATLALVALLRRRVPNPTLRWLTLGGWVVLARGAVKVLDLPARFPGLRDAFSPTEFAVETLLGWLASPGDFALSAVTYLLCVICVTYAFRHLPIPRSALGRRSTVLLAVLTSAVAVALWLLAVDAAVWGGQTPFFQANTFIPAAPPALMLFGLVAITATTYLVAHIVLRRGLRSLPDAEPQITRVLLLLGALVATGAVTAWLATPHVAGYALVAIATLAAGRGEGRLAMALPGRVLVLSVLAVALAYPVLWSHVAQRERETLTTSLDELLAGEDVTKAGVAAALADTRADPLLAAALRDAAAGGRPEGIAMHLWLREAGQWQRSPSVVTVLDARGRTLEKVSLTTLPPKLLPVARPPAGEEDEEVIVWPGDARSLRCVVGRVRVRDEGGEALGHVVFTVADRMDLKLKGLADLAATSDADRPLPLAAGRQLQYAELSGGRVIASSDPGLPRGPGSFGPTAIGRLDADDFARTWDDGASQGSARWSEERGGVFAVRREPATLGSALLALARVVVVGVGLGLLASVGCLLFTLRSFQLQLQHKILISYFVVSVVPLVLLGLASARETQKRHEDRLTERLQTDLTRVRNELEVLGSGVFDAADSGQLEEWAPQRRHDTLLYRNGRLEAASRTGLVVAELLPPWLPPSAYRATVLEQRQTIRREAVYAGRAVWFGYAPVLDAFGSTRATVGVPLLYDADRIEEQLTLTGSVMLAAYMLTLVLVLVGGIYAARRLARPLGDLAAAADRVAAGELDVEIGGAGADEMGQVVGAFNAMTRELRDMTERLAQAERESAWRRMASQVAHEIKNPLTPMRLMLQQMQADLARDPARAAEAIRQGAPRVLAQIQSLDRIARDFAQFARLPQRRPDKVDVGALVRDVTVLYAGAAAEGVTVRADAPDGLPPVWWDPEELRRVLHNMILNAMEATEDRTRGGVVDLHATAATRRGRPGVLVTIRDEGVGIAPEHAERLFEPQFSTKTRGTGLGLAIVNRIVQDLGGTIDFESAPGAGTTFRLWWPSSPPAA